MNQYGLYDLWVNGGWFIRIIAIILVLLSIVSWTIIVSKINQYLRLSRYAKSSATSLNIENQTNDNPYYLMTVCAQESLNEYAKVQSKIELAPYLSENIRSIIDSQQLKQQNHLFLLASIGATSPFIGLLGTVVGIYHALIGIGVASRVGLEQIAGPVGETLIMTALGLIVAIPAVLGYNIFVRLNKRHNEALSQFARRLFFKSLSQS